MFALLSVCDFVDLQFKSIEWELSYLWDMFYLFTNKARKFTQRKLENLSSFDPELTRNTHISIIFHLFFSIDDIAQRIKVTLHAVPHIATKLINIVLAHSLRLNCGQNFDDNSTDAKIFALWIKKWVARHDDRLNAALTLDGDMEWSFFEIQERSYVEKIKNYVYWIEFIEHSFDSSGWAAADEVEWNKNLFLCGHSSRRWCHWAAAERHRPDWFRVPSGKNRIFDWNWKKLKKNRRFCVGEKRESQLCIGSFALLLLLLSSRWLPSTLCWLCWAPTCDFLDWWKVFPRASMPIQMGTDIESPSWQPASDVRCMATTWPELWVENFVKNILLIINSSLF